MLSKVLGVLATLLLCIGATGTAQAKERVAAESASQDSAGQVLLLLRLAPPHVRPGADYAGSYGDGASRAARRRMANALARAHGLTVIDDWPMPLLSVDCFVLAVPAGRSLDEVSATLAAAPGVEWSQPVNHFETQSASVRGGDPLFRAQPAAIEWHLGALHKIADGRGARVAVVDSQIETTHPDLAGQVQWSKNFVGNRPGRPEQHGTAVAGIIAAHANNGMGIAGIAPRARLMALRACWQQGPGRNKTICDSFSLAKAIYFAVENGANVINLSLGGPPDPLLARLLDKAIGRGIVVVAAFDASRPKGGFPASHRGVVAVKDDASGVTTRDVYIAPGRGVPTTQVGGKWSLVDGSSFSAAHVSGLFALLRGNRSTTRGPLKLIARWPNGGEINSCATLLRTTGTGGCPQSR